MIDYEEGESAPKGYHFFPWGYDPKEHVNDWSFGIITGPDNDLICVKKAVSNGHAFALLSPVCKSRFLAFISFLCKCIAVRWDKNVTCQTWDSYRRAEMTSKGTLKRFHDMIEEDYSHHPTGCGNSFDEILCHEIHSNGLTFLWLAAKWNIPVSFLGEIIHDHCLELE